MRRLTQRESTAAQWEREMKNILTSVQEASAIFKDLSMLVIEQGAIVDRIDFNLEQAEENMDAGIENLIVVRVHLARGCARGRQRVLIVGVAVASLYSHRLRRSLRAPRPSTACCCCAWCSSSR